MDGWTEKQLQIFNHGGNKRLGDFYKANGVPVSEGLRRYSTPSGEWYRESWIKNRTMGRPVPAPPANVKVGPCVDTSSAAAGAAATAEKPKATAPVVDLLDMGGEAKATAAKPAPTADLLGFDDSSKPAETDLLGFGGADSGGDLPDWMAAVAQNARPNASSSGATKKSGESDLLGLAATTQSAGPDLSSLDFMASPSAASAPMPSVAAAPFSGNSFAPTMPAMPAQPAANSLAGLQMPAANTLAGGAKLVEKEEEKKEEDIFAMALGKWG